MFQSRQQAGLELAQELLRLQLDGPVVLALPRGGAPVAAEIAYLLKAPLDLLIVQKVGAPGNPELAVAAIVEGDPADVVLNREMVEAFGLDDSELRALVARERPELERRRLAYRGHRRRLRSTTGKTVILVDDGAATGITMKVAVRAIRRRSPREIVVALPVAPPDVVTELAREADRVVCVRQPVRFVALSHHYRDFPRLSDEEVIQALRVHGASGSMPR